MFALVVLFFCAIAAPMSWKKAQFQDRLVWCGWDINFSHDSIQLMSGKLAKRLLSKASRFRSWLAPLYALPVQCAPYHLRRGQRFEPARVVTSKRSLACQAFGSQKDASS